METTKLSNLPVGNGSGASEISEKLKQADAVGGEIDGDRIGRLVVGGRHVHVVVQNGPASGTSADQNQRRHFSARCATHHTRLATKYTLTKHRHTIDTH